MLAGAAAGRLGGGLFTAPLVESTPMAAHKRPLVRLWRLLAPPVIVIAADAVYGVVLEAFPADRASTLTCTPRVLHQLSLFVFLALLGGITGATSSLLVEEACGLLCAFSGVPHVPSLSAGSRRHNGHLSCHTTQLFHDYDISCRHWKPVFLTGTKELSLSRETSRSLRIEKTHGLRVDTVALTLTFRCHKHKIISSISRIVQFLQCEQFLQIQEF